MNTNGLELNVNDLIDQVIQLTEEKMLAEAKVERLEYSVEQWKRQHQSDQELLKHYEQKGASV